MDDLSIPEFLKIPQEERQAAWKGRKLTKPSTTSVKITRNEDAGTRALRREIERQRKAKQNARFKMLRERAAQKKRKR